MTSIYEIPQKIKCLSDKRERKSIPLFNIVMPVLLFLMLQYESFHTVFSAPESMGRRLKNCIRGKVPKVDAVRDLLSRIDPEEVRKIHEETIDTLKKNRVFREGTIGGYVVAGMDGVELFSSTKKSCPGCLTRKNRAGETEYFHRSVVCMTVGKAPHVILGQEMLKPRDGAGKDEGELTGGKQVVRYHESWEENGKETERWIWLVTTLEQTPPEILWEMMNRRWDIEENGFHQLKTYYHAKHCYCHAAVEVIFNLMIIGFNMRELYLYRRIQRFERSGITRKSVSRIFRDELLTEKVKKILYQKGG